MELVQHFPSYQTPPASYQCRKDGGNQLTGGSTLWTPRGRFGGFLKMLSSLPGARGGGHTVPTALQESRSPRGPPAAVLEAAGSVSPARREKRLRRPGRLDPRSPLLSVSLSLLFAKNSFLGQPFETHVIFHQRSVYFRCVSGPVLSWWTGSVLAQPAVCLRPLVSRTSRDPPVGSTGLSGHVSTCSPGGGPGNQGLGASI